MKSENSHQKSGTILITIDVEDWFQVENLRPWFPPSQWSSQTLRVEKNTRQLLDLFDTFDFPVKATFFVLGWVADRFPELVSEIADRGHEVASHGYSHLLCSQMDKKVLLEDLIKSKNKLRKLTGTEITGYRAPSFSIDDAVLDAIHRAGYSYDSSYNSFAMHGRYGIISNSGCKKNGIAFRLKSNLVELPVSNLELGGKILPWAGGGYFRLFPFKLFTAGVRKILNQNGTYLFYMHPWEIDPQQPRVKSNGKNGRCVWRHYINLDKTYKRIHRLITEFKQSSFITCREYVNSHFG